MSEETTPGEAGELRDLLAAVLEALTLSHGADDYKKRLVDRAGWAQTTIKGALEEDPAGIGWNADFLRQKLAAEEAAAGPVRDPQSMVDEPSQVWPPTGEEQPATTEPVKESTYRYAEELRQNPGTASADGHTGWECRAGASLIVEASTPGPGKLGTHHGVIYACAGHQAAAVERITASGYEVDPRPAPPGHRWNPWPCGHVTAYDAAALAALSGK